MKRSRTKHGIIFLLTFVLVFASLGTAGFAGKPAKPPKPAKTATIEIVESQPLLIPSGSNSVQATLVIMNHDGNAPTLDPSDGTAVIIDENIKRKQTTYIMEYTMAEPYNGNGSETVIAKVKNIDGQLTEETIYIQIETDTPPPNQPPVNTQVPDIISSFVTGTDATPVPGIWEDNDSASFTIVRIWELDGVALEENPDDGALYLDESWEGKSLVLKEVATDDEGASGTASSSLHMISAPAPEALLYVALGDSIATGTVAPSMPNETPYIHAFKTYLESETGQPVTMKDYSEDGDHSSHLLGKLTNSDGANNALVQDVTDADVITVSIGGNNLMSAAKYTTYVLFFIKVDYYDFDRIDIEKAEAGRVAFVSEFPQIINKIREYNATARIVVNDLYNPFNKTTDLDNYNLVESYFHRTDNKGVNDVIRTVCASTNGINYADVYDRFEGYAGGDGKENLTYMYITDTYFGFELRNPHPNSVGQGLVEAAVEAAYDLIP